MKVAAAWQQTTLGDALEVLIDHRGKTPGKLGGDWTSEGVPVISAIHVKHGRVDWSQRLRYVSSQMFDRWMPERVQAGDVLLTSEAPLGAVAQVPDDRPLVISQRLFVLRGKHNVLDQRYLRHWLTSPDAQTQLRRRSSGSTVTGIRQAELRQMHLRLPPIGEQRRIVEILEDHMSRLDTAGALLRTTARRVETWLVSYRHSRLQEASGGSVAEFHDLFVSVSDDGRRVDQREYLPNGLLPIVDQGETVVGGYTNDENLRVRVEGPVLVFGDHTRRVKYIDFPFAVGAQGVKLLKPTEGVHPRFAYWSLSDSVPPSRGYGRHFAMLRAQRFRTAPPQDQADIAKAIDAAGEQRLRVEAACRMAVARGDLLRQALLRAAFSGEMSS